jgi:hypothetical protein
LGVTGERIQNVVIDFLEVARLARAPLNAAEIQVEFMPAPHRRPTKLPQGKMAVYAFGVGEICLKVGKAGPKSVQRYTYHHYNDGSAPSTLAASILRHLERGGDLQGADVSALSAEVLGPWIEHNKWRANLLLDARHSPILLSLLEAFVQARLSPLFEGSSQGGPR